MDEHQLKVFATIVMKNTFWGTNVRRKNICLAISEEFFEDEGDVSPPKSLPRVDETNPPSNPTKFETLISIHDLTGIVATQIIKLIGYIKH